MLLELCKFFCFTLKQYILDIYIKIRRVDICYCLDWFYLIIIMRSGVKE